MEDSGFIESKKREMMNKGEIQDDAAKNRLDKLFSSVKAYHQKNITGRGVKVAIFDSGLAEKYLKQKELDEQNEKTLSDLQLLKSINDEFEDEEGQNATQRKLASIQQRAADHASGSKTELETVVPLGQDLKVK